MNRSRRRRTGEGEGAGEGAAVVEVTFVIFFFSSVAFTFLLALSTMGAFSTTPLTTFAVFFCSVGVVAGLLALKIETGAVVVGIGAVVVGTGLEEEETVDLEVVSVG